MKRTSAYYQALQEAEQAGRDRETPAPASLSATRRYVKATFYLEEEQLYKLDDLVIRYRRMTHGHLNRNELMRRLVGRLSPDEILGCIA